MFDIDDTHLLSLPEDINMMYQIKANNVIIPCRPTSPHMNIQAMDTPFNLDVSFYNV